MDSLSKPKSYKLRRWEILTQFVVCFDLFVGLLSISTVILFSLVLPVLFAKITKGFPEPDKLFPKEMTINRLAVLRWSIVSSDSFLDLIFLLVATLIFAMLTWTILWHGFWLLEAITKNDFNSQLFSENQSMAMHEAGSWRKHNIKLLYFVVAVILATWQNQTWVLLGIELGFIMWRLIFVYIVNKFIWELEISAFLSRVRAAEYGGTKNASTVVTV